MKIVTIPANDFVAMVYHPETIRWTLVMKKCVMRDIEMIVLEEQGITIDLKYASCENCEKECKRLIWGKDYDGTISDTNTQTPPAGAPATETP